MSASLHDRDFSAWATEQAELLRQGRFAELDAVGARERRELETRLSILLQHLLNWRYQRERRGSSWLRTIKIQRIDAKRVLEDNPGLKAKLPELIDGAYERARILATDETGMDEADFPETLPFRIENVLSADYLPED
ncbi:DUF29 domain-containing protein [Methylolobus aquaticus]